MPVQRSDLVLWISSRANGDYEGLTRLIQEYLPLAEILESSRDLDPDIKKQAQGVIDLLSRRPWRLNRDDIDYLTDYRRPLAEILAPHQDEACPESETCSS